MYIEKRKINKLIIVLIILCIFMAGTIFMVVDSLKKSEFIDAKQIEIERKDYTNSMLNAMETNDAMFNDNMDIYEKINEMKDLRFLIVAQSSINTNHRYDINASWQKEFEKVLIDYVESDYTIDTLLLRGSHIGWAYIQAMTDLKDKTYDLMIMDVDEGSTLPLYYEVFLRTIIKQNPKIEIMSLNNEALNLNIEKDTSEKDTSEKDTSVKDTSEKDTSEKDTSEKDTSEKDTSVKDTSVKEQTGIDRIKELYGVSTLVINRSDRPIIIEDNDADIANAIIEDLLHNMDSNKEVSYSLPDIEEKELELLDAITAIKGNVLPTRVNGFYLNKGLLYNLASNSSLEYQVIEPLVCLNYVTFNEGGRFEVYMNDVLINTVDSYSDVTGVGVVLLPITTEMKLIRIQTIEQPEYGRYVMLHNLLLGSF